MQKHYQSLNIQADIFDFSLNWKKNENADLAISRAGASTLLNFVLILCPLFLYLILMQLKIINTLMLILQDQALCQIMQNSINLDEFLSQY